MSDSIEFAVREWPEQGEAEAGPKTFRVGQEVRFVQPCGHWYESYYSEEHFCDTHHNWHLGHVVFADADTVAVWAQKHNGEQDVKGMAMYFVPVTDVFDTEHYDDLRARIEQLNVEKYGHKDGDIRFRVDKP